MGYNELEFVLDFGQLYQDSQRELLHTRVVTNPAYVGVLLDILQESIAKYERAFGTIPEVAEPE